MAILDSPLHQVLKTPAHCSIKKKKSRRHRKVQIEALNFEIQKGKKIKRKRENKRDSNSTIGIPAVPIAIFENHQLKVQ